ncbi:MAG: M23 family metallopeptidase [Nitratireductor sp.]|nr:M23 family metallopeptidase [Nitratireductor sp.]
MATSDTYVEAQFLGDHPPLKQNGRRQPDKRRVSFRWLSGAVLAGLGSVFLMGGALFAALDGREILAVQGQVSASRDSGQKEIIATKGDRPGIATTTDTSTSRVMMVSTITREGERDVVKVKPFLKVSTPLAIPPKRDTTYPPFDALAVFSDSSQPEPEPDESAANDQIYGAQVESEVTITVIDFDPESPLIAKGPAQRESDIEEMIRAAAPGLDTGATSVASLAYFDPSRFSLQDSGFLAAPGVTITEENVSLAVKKPLDDRSAPRHEERVIRVRSEASISTILEAEGMGKEDAAVFEKVLSADIGSTNLLPEDRLRVSHEGRPGDPEGAILRPGRVSVYRGGQHLVSIARTQDNRHVYAAEPQLLPQNTASSAPATLSASSRLPTIYDAIYRAALSEGLDLDMARRLIRVFAFDIDFNSTITPNDKLSFFVSLEDGKDKPSEKSEVLFASITTGSLERRYYRFRDPETGQVDYYDETGKSAKKFLLRQPVPNGKFRSPYGMRTHPILRYRKMHWGVDWAAPRGTPIIAAGNGVVESAGWESGYGKQTVIRHANGYVTSYSHQSKIFDFVKPGARVRQGQVIGHVGSTGLSTGPHLHYEVSVNGSKVDPMRIRLPKGRELKGKELAAFNAERERLDELLNEGEDGDSPQLAQF